MKKYIILVLVIISTIGVKSQQEQGGIRYYFGSKIDTIINLAVDSSLLDLEKSESYILTCSESDTVVFISLLTYCQVCEIYDSIGNINYWVGYLAKNTNRYYLLKTKKVPVIFSHFDKTFGVVKMIDEEKGYVRRSIQLFSEFESQVNIEANIRGDEIYKLTCVR